MRKIFFILAVLASCFLPLSARAQTQTNVTATIVDPLGIPYAYGTYSIQLIPTGTNPTVNGNSIGGAFNGSTDANGSFNVSLWANANIVPASSQWQFTVCVSPGVQPPLGTGGQCTPPTAVTISGASQSLSATLNAVAPKLTTITLGSGSVTSFSAGALSPLFSTSVATSTTTPALSFSLTNAAANKVFGNCTGVLAAPNYCSITTAMLPATTGTILGTAAATDVAFGTGVNTIGTNANFTFTTGSGVLSIPNGGAYQLNGVSVLSTPNSNLNTAVGRNAGANISTNQNTTFVGLSAGQQLGAGNSNTAMGSFAMGLTSTGSSENTAMGSGAMENVASNDNTGIGFDALLTVAGGSGRNTAVGAGADGNGTGSDNTVMGFQAGENLSTGNLNIIIGDADQSTVTTGSSNIVISNSSTGIVATNSNQLDLGEVVLGVGLNVPSTSTITMPGSEVVNGSQSSATYKTATNCSSSASPAVCGSAAAGSVAIAAAGTTLTVNTSAVTANSQIIIEQDDSLGTKLGITCNSGILAGPTAITARVPGTSFTISVTTGLTVNPVCLSYIVFN